MGFNIMILSCHDSVGLGCGWPRGEMSGSADGSPAPSQGALEKDGSISLTPRFSGVASGSRSFLTVSIQRFSLCLPGRSERPWARPAMQRSNALNPSMSPFGFVSSDRARQPVRRRIEANAGRFQMGPLRAVFQEPRRLLQSTTRRYADRPVHFTYRRNSPGVRILEWRQNLARAFLAQSARPLDI